MWGKKTHVAPHKKVTIEKNDMRVVGQGEGEMFGMDDLGDDEAEVTEEERRRRMETARDRSVCPHLNRWLGYRTKCV